MAITWKIFYSDGSTFSNDQGGVEDAPSFGVQVILVKDKNVGRRILRLSDYYLWRPSLNRWTDHEDSASVILAMASESWSKLLCGQYLNEEDFEKILIRAHNDPDLPPKSRGEPPHPAWKE